MDTAGVDRLVEWSGRLADLANSGHVPEEHAVDVLVDAVARDSRRLRDAALQAQRDPDAVPLVTALLERAARSADRPIRVRTLQQHAAPPPDRVAHRAGRGDAGEAHPAAPT